MRNHLTLDSLFADGVMNLCFRDTYPPTDVVNPAWLQSPSRRLLATAYAYFRKINGTGVIQESFTRAEFHKAMRFYFEQEQVYSREDGKNSAIIWVTQPSRQYVEAKNGLALVVRFRNDQEVVASRRARPGGAVPAVAEVGLDPMTGITVEQLHHPLLSTVLDPFSALLCSHRVTSTRRLFPILLGKIILHGMIQVLLKDDVELDDIGFCSATIPNVLSHPIGLGLQVRHLYSSDDKAKMALKNHTASFLWRKIKLANNYSLGAIVRGKGCQVVWKQILDGLQPLVFTKACQVLALGRPISAETRQALESYEGVSGIEPLLDDEIDLLSLAGCYETALARTFESTQMTAKFVTMMAKTRIEYVKLALPLYASMSESSEHQQFRRLTKYTEWFTGLRPSFTSGLTEMTMTGSNSISRVHRRTRGVSGT